MRKLKFGILVLIMSLFVTACGCQKQTINVSFDTDGGSEVKTQIIEKGNTAEVPSEPTKEGYTFEGWYRSDTATEEFDFSTKLDKDTTLYAKWSMKVSTEVEKPEKDDKEEKVELSVNKTSVKLEVGKSTTIKVTTNSDKKVTWSTSDKKIATVKDGKITAVKVGSATITVSVDGEKETIKVTVVKASATTKTTTTKKVETTKPTTKPTTTTKKPDVKPDVISHEMIDVPNDTAGQVTLYILKNGNRVSGKCDITWKSGKTVTVDVPASGLNTNKNIIVKIENEKAN